MFLYDIGDKDSHQSMSDYHPGSWNPAWSVASMYVHARLTGPKPRGTPVVHVHG